jgi:hypothetical protein
MEVLKFIVFIQLLGLVSSILLHLTMWLGGDGKDFDISFHWIIQIIILAGCLLTYMLFLVAMWLFH